VAMRRDAVTDGEAFNNSFNLMISEDRLQDHKIVWANTVGHELFHYWTNGLHGDDNKNFEWFSEGFTEYYASLTLARTGIVPDELWHRKLERYFSRYFIMRNMVGDRASLVEAGQDKMKNWLLIYGGGASIAFVMDVTIRESTDGKRSLDDFMRRMVEEYNNKPFTMNDMERLASDVAGKDMKPFFDAYVRGKNLPPLADTAEEIGLELSHFADEYYVAKDPTATAEQNTMYDSLLRRRP
jgi:predicted metalloprotease with PDZ domain